MFECRWIFVSSFIHYSYIWVYQFSWKYPTKLGISPFCCSFPYFRVSYSNRHMHKVTKYTCFEVIVSIAINAYIQCLYLLYINSNRRMYRTLDSNIVPKKGWLTIAVTSRNKYQWHDSTIYNHTILQYWNRTTLRG